MEELTDSISLNSLEYRRILSRLAACALSPEGSNKISEPVFYSSYSETEAVRKMVVSLGSLLSASEFLPSRVSDTSVIADKISKSGVVLDGRELADTADFIDSASAFTEFCRGSETLADLAGLSACPDIRFISLEIKECFTTDGEINPALPEIKQVLAEINSFEKKNDVLLKKYMKEWSDYLMFANPTSKEGRLVLPVKSEHKSRAKGVVHQISQTGSTLFIEPLEILENNNALLQAKAEYERIVLQYCRQMSELLHLNRNDFDALKETFINLDGIYMRARFMKDADCVFPAFRERGFELTQARHLLLAEKPVPLDLKLEHPLRALVISGSNAGGKTVALKTLGLCVLMNQAAIPVPAAEDSALCFFSFVAADIGDSQSIDESRSTFSGHLFRIRDILAGKRSSGLVLLDELGTGTSDEEGAALGISFLNHLTDSGNTVAATTHNRKIKEHAFGSELFEIASVNFSEDRHVPVFGLSYGIHGDSHGIDTAVYCGIPDNIISDAMELLKSGESELDRALEKIKRMENDLARKQSELDNAGQQLDSQYDVYQKEIAKLSKAREAYKLELEELLIDMNRKIDNLKQSNIVVSKSDEKMLKESVYARLADVEKETELEEKKPAPVRAADEKLERGVKVFSRSYGREGEIIDSARNNMWLVRIGSLKIALDDKDLTPVRSTSGPVRPVVDRGHSVDSAALNLDFRGKTVEEAIETVNRQIDSMIVNGQTWFSVIHGHGPLQQGLREYLSSHPLVKSLKYSDQAGGGRGRSIVYLDN